MADEIQEHGQKNEPPHKKNGSLEKTDFNGSNGDYSGNGAGRQQFSNGGGMVTDDPNALTVLRSLGRRRMTKDVRRDGKIITYDDAKWFAATVASVATPGELAELLAVLSRQPCCCVVAGAIVEGANRAKMRRLCHVAKDGAPATLLDVPRYVLPLDVDTVAVPDGLDARDLRAAASAVREALPKPFHSAACVAVATSGYRLKPGLRFRMWFRFARALTCAELKRWMELEKAPIDFGVLHAAGIAYTAAPVFENPAHDPLPDGRMVMLEGDETVIAPSAEDLRPPPRAVTECRVEDDDEWQYIQATTHLINNDGDGVDYDTWLLAGMALHSTGDARALDLWNKWSARSSKFELTKRQDKVWDSFRADGETRIGTLFWMAEPYLEKAAAAMQSPANDKMFDEWLIETGHCTRAEIDAMNERIARGRTARRARVICDWGGGETCDAAVADGAAHKRALRRDCWVELRRGLITIRRSRGAKRDIARGALRIAEQVVIGRLDGERMARRVIEAAAEFSKPDEINEIFNWALRTARSHKEAAQ